MATQRTRVLDALRRTGDYGICQVDFFAPNVTDGGKPITRLAARIQELRDQGFAITSSGTRHGCAVYRLKETPSSTGPASLGGHSLVAESGPVEDTSPSLFDPRSLTRPPSPYDTLSDAA